MTVNSEIEWDQKVFNAYEYLLRDATTKLNAIDKIINPNTDPWKQLAEIREVLDS